MKLYDYEKEHLARIRAGLSECMVLLKKDGTFPLKQPGKMAAYGNGVVKTLKGGTGSGEVNSRFNINIYDGLTAAGFEITTDDWLLEYDRQYATAKKSYKKQLKKEAREAGISYLMYSMGAAMPEPEYDIPLGGGGDACIYVLSRISGEGSDRRVIPGDFLLSKTEIRDILELNKKFEKFMLVINAGGVVDLSPVMEAKNILILSKLGVETGLALSDVILGRENPSGKLTTTWATYSDYCPDIDFGNTQDSYYNEGIYVGYRYFDTVGKRPLFPFGYGLSYTDFEINDVDTCLEDSLVTVSATVQNTGHLLGKEVLQLYMSAPGKRLKNPFQDLVAFGKTRKLFPGESENIPLEFDLKDFASFDEGSLSYVLEEGEYILRVGNSRR